MNNDNFVAIQPRTVVQYTMKCETTTKIYSVPKLSTLTYVHYVIFWFLILCFIDFVLTLCFIFSYLYLKLFVVSPKKYFFQTRFVCRIIREQKQSYSEVPLYTIFMSLSQLRETCERRVNSF